MFLRKFVLGSVSMLSIMAGAAASEPGQSKNSEFPGKDDPQWQQARYIGNDPYIHNGSEIEEEQRGDFIHLTYVKPRPSLAKTGITPGTLLFSGRRHEDIIFGVAYTFKANCPPAPYPVRGRFDNQKNLVLEGNAPKRGGGCEIIGYPNADRNNRLVFQGLFGDE